MTIEQKAKRYDETLKAAVVAHKDEDRHLKAALENIFPELRESEDERIRKALIDYFDDANKADENPLQSYGIHTDKAIAWLEKQGERQTPQNNERAWLYLVADVLTWREGIGQYLDNPKVQELAKKLQKEYGQKLYIEEQGNPTDINPSEFDLRLNKLLKQFETLPKEELASSLSFYLNVVQNDGTYKAEEKQGEQKPADRVEDEEYNGEDYGIDSLFHAQRILEKTLGSVEGYQTDDGILSHKCAISAVKKLYEQKSAWSEVDKDFMYDTLSNLTELKDRYGEGYGNVGKCIDWLKSLRPQKQWKPTEAQLASLTIACDRNDRIGFDLTQLLQELKKL